MNKLILMLPFLFLLINTITIGSNIKLIVDPNDKNATVVSVKYGADTDLFHVYNIKSGDKIYVSLRIKNSSSPIAVISKQNTSYIVYFTKNTKSGKNKHITKDSIKTLIKISKGEDNSILAKEIDLTIIDYAYISTIFLEWNDLIDSMNVINVKK